MMAPGGDVRSVDGSSAPRGTTRRRTLAAVVIGNVVEWYDVAVFGALALVLARVFFPGSDDQTALILTFAVFATSFLAALGSFAAWRAPETAFADLPTHRPAAPDPVGGPIAGELAGD